MPRTLLRIVGFLLLAGTVCVTTVQACTHQSVTPAGTQAK